VEDGGRLHHALSLALTEFDRSHSSPEGGNRKEIKKIEDREERGIK
jgi:hypothetical protein